MEDDTRYLINNLKLMIRRIVREELSESNQNEINLEDYRCGIEDIIQDYVNNNLNVTVELG